MTINNREIRFRRTVLANCILVESAPQGDLGRLIKEKLMHKNYATAQKTAALIMTALSRGYEAAEAFRDKAYQPNPLTEEEALSLDPAEFNALYEECMKVFYGDGVITVQTESTGKKTDEAET